MEVFVDFGCEIRGIPSYLVLDARRIAARQRTVTERRAMEKSPAFFGISIRSAFRLAALGQLTL
jgi:hypothetical protein